MRGVVLVALLVMVGSSTALERLAVFDQLELFYPEEDSVFMGRHLLERTSYGMGAPVSDRFCGLNDEGQCDFENYGWYLFGLMIPGFIFAGLSCCFIPFFLCGRCVCNSFGGKEPGHGACGSSADLFEGYTKNEIYGLKGLLAMLLFITFVCSIVGWTGNSQVTTGISGFLEAVIQAGRDTVAKVEAIKAILLSISYSQDAARDLDPAIKAGNDVIAQGQSIKKQVDVYDLYRSRAINLSLAAPIIIMTFATLTSFTNLKGFSICWGMMICLSLVFLFLSLSIHRLVENAVADICAEFERLLAGTAGTQSAGLQQLLQCATDGSLGFQSMVQAGYDGIDTAVESGCNATRCLCEPSLCRPGVYPDSNCPSECNRTTLPLYLEIEVVDPMDPTTERTVRECSVNCPTRQMQEDSLEVVEAVDAVIRYADVIEHEIIPLLNCDFVNTMVERVNTAVCEDVHDGTQTIKRVSGVMCAFLMIAVIALILGQKRFIPLNDRDCRESWNDDIAMDPVVGDKAIQ